MPFSTHPRVKTRPSFSSSASPNDLDSASISSGSTQQQQLPSTPIEDYPDLKPLPKSHAPMACIDPALAIPFDLSILTISHKKDHNAVKAVIVGGGIAGLSLAIMMARAGIEYIILERSTGLEPPIGGATVLGPPVLRLIEQIGLLPQVEAASKTLSGLTIVDGESRKIGRLDGIDQDRYGYPLRLIARQDLHRILLDHVPKEHIQHGKLVVETLQNPNGASCKCSDGSTYYGDIIVGADGSHSLTRDRMYTHLKEQGKLPDADMEPSCYEHITIGGVTGPLDKTIYPAAHESTAEMHAIYTKDAPYSFWYMPVGGSRVAWGITNTQSPKHKIHNYSRPNHITTSPNANNPTTTTAVPPFSSTRKAASHTSAVTSSSSSSSNNSNSSSVSSHIAMIPAPSGNAANFVAMQGGTGFQGHTSGLAAHSGYTPNKSTNATPPPLSRTSSAQKIHDDWFVPSSVDLEMQFKDLLNARCAIGVGTVRDFIAKTPNGTMFAVDVEERLNKTWHHGRIVLIGDACHQLLPIGGQGAVQSMLDSVCLVNLLYDMEFNTPSEISKVFKKYYAKRSSLAKASLEETSQLDRVFHGQGLMAEMKRKFIFNAFWSSNMKNDKCNNNRPQLSFLPFVEDRGVSKANRQKISGRLLANNKTFAV